MQGAAGSAIRPLDLTPEPDVLETWADVTDFRAGQDRLSAMLRSGELTLRTLDRGIEKDVTVRPEPTRPLGSLSAEFWVQIAVGVISCFIGAWVWALKPSDWSTRLFALSGLAMMLSTHSAAIYSGRELALPMELFRPLSGINAAGAAGFGVAMINLFLIYPRPLVKPRWFLLTLTISTVWWSVWYAEIAPVPTLSSLHILTLMLALLGAIGVQVWANRKDPSSRAVLAWLGLSVAVGSGAFVFSSAAPILLGFGPVVSQGYAFVCFLIIYVGLALGLRRYRLFEMGEWAFRILFYTGAALAFLGLDAALIWALHLAPASALGLAVVAVAFLYLPLRDLIWRKTVARRRVTEEELFEAVIEIAFAASSAARAERWKSLLARLFAPLETSPIAFSHEEPEASSDGLELTLPATADSPALRLRYPFQGRGLFGPMHLKLARQLAQLMRNADVSRDAFERGAAGERRRIARDLHDDVGARLLSGLHKPDVDQTRDVLREAIADMRTIVGGLTGAALPLSKVVAELRHETDRRLEAAGIGLDWPVSEVEADETPLPYRVYKNWGSAHREIVTNAIKHSGGKLVSVRIARSGETLVETLSDDGKGMKGRKKGGNGLGNIEKRMAELGGTIAWPKVSTGVSVRVTIPLSPAEFPGLEPSGIHA
jgi:signal transduction histidine kinase